MAVVISFYGVNLSRLQVSICNLLALNNESRPENLVLRSPAKHLGESMTISTEAPVNVNNKRGDPNTPDDPSTHGL